MATRFRATPTWTCCMASTSDLMAISEADPAEYEALRVSLGVPKGGVDFAYGDAFPSDANMDLLHGVDFRSDGDFRGRSRRIRGAEGLARRPQRRRRFRLWRRVSERRQHGPVAWRRLQI